MIWILTCWQLLNFYYYPKYVWGDSGTTFSFPVTNGLSTRYPAFLVSIQAQSMDLSNATITCTFTLETEPGTTFRFGCCNASGPRPASARLFFSSVPGYSNSGTGSTNYWFNTPWVEIGTNTTTATLSATLDPAAWTDAGGCNECPPSTADNFWSAVASVRQIGISFGGGSFYDTGIAVEQGACTFHLQSFTVDARISVAVQGGFSQGQYVIEQSDDLNSWQSITNKFFRARLLLPDSSGINGTNPPPPPP